MTKHVETKDGMTLFQEEIKVFVIPLRRPVLADALMVERIKRHLEWSFRDILDRVLGPFAQSFGYSMNMPRLPGQSVGKMVQIPTMPCVDVTHFFAYGWAYDIAKHLDLRERLPGFHSGLQALGQEALEAAGHPWRLP